MDTPTLVKPRQATTTDIPDGFVEQNGRLVPYWYSRVSSAPSTGPRKTSLTHPFFLTLARSYHILVMTTRSLTAWHHAGGPHHQMGRLPRHGRLLHRVRDDRLLPRQAENTKGPRAAGVPQGMSLASLVSPKSRMKKETASLTTTTSRAVAHLPPRARPRRPALRLPAARRLPDLPARLLRHAGWHATPAAHVRCLGTAAHV